MKVQAYASHAKSQPLEPYSFELAPPGAGEVAMEVTHCGLCHSDLHLIDEDWGPNRYPLIPGHEVIGVIRSVGQGVDPKRIGQRVGVGWQSGSCGECESCKNAEEHLCEKPVATCAGRAGGFATHLLTKSHFAIDLPAGLPSEAAAPLLCGGVTVFSPLSRHTLGSRLRVGVLGVGGLGHLAIQFASRMGHEVTALSTSDSKRADCERWGARHFANIKDAESAKKLDGELDFILATVHADLQWRDVFRWLAPHGHLCFVGVPAKPLELAAGDFIQRERVVSGSNIGSPRKISEMLEFAARHNVRAETEVLPIAQVNTAVGRLRKNDVRYRFVFETAPTAW